MYPFASEETPAPGMVVHTDIKEIRDMSLRFEGAIMLEKGDNYNQISEKIGLSPATISRISRCLNYGSGGYRAAIERIAKENEDK